MGPDCISSWSLLIFLLWLRLRLKTITGLSFFSTKTNWQVFVIFVVFFQVHDEFGDGRIGLLVLPLGKVQKGVLHVVGEGGAFWLTAGSAWAAARDWITLLDSFRRHCSIFKAVSASSCVRLGLLEVEMQLCCLWVVQFRLLVELWMPQLYLGVEQWVVEVDMHFFCLWGVTAFSWAFASCPSSLSTTGMNYPSKWSKSFIYLCVTWSIRICTPYAKRTQRVRTAR